MNKRHGRVIHVIGQPLPVRRRTCLVLAYGWGWLNRRPGGWL